MKTKTVLFLIPSILLIFCGKAWAQKGFVPELLGNASGVERPGFAIKYFNNYYYQERIKANDIEVAFEPQVWIKGFYGDMEKDQFQFIVHVPFGYRREWDAAAGEYDSVTGLGTTNANVEYYYRLIDTEDTTWWFDNAVSFGFPTATDHEGTRVGGQSYNVAIGGNSYSLGWFQESFIKHKRFMASIMPVMVTWNWKDSKSKTRGGMSLNIMNGSVGYGITEDIFLGADFGMLLGSVMGSKTPTSRALPVSFRAYAGPALLFSFAKDSSLQVSTAIDIATKEIDRGQGIYVVLFHMF